MGPECTPDGTGQLVGAVFTRMASMEPEFALRMEPALSSSGGVFCLLQWSRSLHSGWNAAEAVGRVVRFPASMEPEFALRMEPPSAPTTTARSMLQWSRSLHSGWNPVLQEHDSQQDSFNGAGVCTPDGTSSSSSSRSRSFSFNGAGVCTPDGTVSASRRPQRYTASMEPEFALRMELFPQNSKGKQALQTAFSSTRTERANLPFHPARGKKKFLYSC